MKRKKIYSRKNVFLYATVAFLLPVTLTLIVYYIEKIHPFGNKTLLTIDMNNQYFSFYSYLQEILKGNHSLFYSFSKTLGGNLSGFSAYYLMSPFNWILIFFSKNNLPDAICLITVLKIGFCGLSFYLFLSWAKQNNQRQKWIFSTCYAMMSYNMVYQQNLMWLDGVILLPLIALGIKWICFKKSPILYIGSLATAIILNYYIGFMLCIFSVIYFLYIIIEFKPNRTDHFLYSLKTYLFSSILSGGFAMWILFPALKSLSGGKAVFSLSNLKFYRNFHLTDFLVKFFTGSMDYQQIKTGLPNVYCGMIVVFFFGMLLLNPGVSLFQKLKVLAIIGILCLSFYINAFNLIWHGFNPPAWFPYRYSFIFSFFLILFAWDGLQSLELYTKQHLLKSCCFLFIITILSGIWMYHRNFEFMNSPKILISICFFAITAVLSIIGKQHSDKIWILVLFTVCLDLVVNGSQTLNVFSYVTYEDYHTLIEKNSPAIQFIKNTDNGFYRMEKNFFYKLNDPMLFDYAGVSHYSSSEKTEIKDFLISAGYCGRDIQVHYDGGSSWAMDSFLGLKYIASEKALDKPWQLLDKINDVYIYQNPYALPMSILTDETVLAFNNNVQCTFEFQNNLWKSLDKKIGKDIFIAEKTSPLIPDADNATLNCSFTAQSDNPVFLYTKSDPNSNYSLFVNGKKIKVHSSIHEFHILHIGSFSPGETVHIQIIPDKNQPLPSICTMQVYYQNMDTFIEYYKNIMQNTCTLKKFSDTNLKGSFRNNTGRDYIVFTFPYDEGWEVLIDEESVNTTKGAGIFLTAKIPSGYHQIELIYHPPGLLAGISLTTASFLLTVIWLTIRYNHQSKEILRTRN